MKTLILHPSDPSTGFLNRIYAPLKDKTVVTGGISKSDLPELIESHDRILMLGHGSPYGLLSIGQFPDAGLYIVDDSMVFPLKNKSNCMFIWCHSDQFVQRNGLSGLCSGMFISQIDEADYWGFDDIDENLINQSNERFASIILKFLNDPLEYLYQRILAEYGILSRTNIIARFNLKRIHLADSGTNKKSFKVSPENKILQDDLSDIEWCPFTPF